jgi:ATP-dependent Clp protease protease subunit
MTMLKINLSADVPEIYLYGEIGPAWAGMIDAMSLIESLEQIGNVPEICLRINSPGGDVFEAIPMIGAIERHSSRIITECDGLAASAASYLFNAGETRRISRYGEVMIHPAWTVAMGNADSLRSVVKALDDVDGTAIEEYAARCADKATADQVSEWLKAETWMKANEAVERGFADEIIERKSTTAAKVARGRYKHTPSEYLDTRTWEQQLRGIAALARQAGPDERPAEPPVEEGTDPQHSLFGRKNGKGTRSGIANRLALRRKALGM